MEKRIVWNTDKVEEISQKLNEGYIFSSYETPFYEKTVGYRRANITFNMTEDEIDEYIKCKLDVFYFANNYCRVKKEDGGYDIIKLRDYQYDMIDLIDKNKYSILMASRQVGKTVIAGIYLLHYMLFNNNKNVLVAANILDTSKEIIDKIKLIYQALPFFLQQGIEVWNQNQIKFENNCRLKGFAMTKTASIGQAADCAYIDEFAYIPDTIANDFYKSIFPTLSSIENSKMIITSTPNGFNLFHDLLINSEREDNDPLKNNFKSIRVYWNQVPGRNVTYFKLNPFRLKKSGLTKEDVFNFCKEKYNPNNETDDNDIPIVQLKPDPNNDNPVIHIQNVGDYNYDFLKKTVIEIGEKKVPITKIAKVSTWKLDQIADIGSEEAFKQEYDLRFITGIKSILTEEAIERLNRNKKEFKFIDHDVFRKLTWDYSNLKWNTDIFDEEQRKTVKGLMSIDLSEGLGQDYSVINMFKIEYKPIKLIKKQRNNIQSMYDFFQLKQFGIFRDNLVSVDQIAELAYLLGFEYFSEDNFKMVVEMNFQGQAFKLGMKNAFEGENNYGGHMIMKFKHRTDSNEKKHGVKVGKNKGLYVKDYKERIENQELIALEKNTVKEIKTFIKHKTKAGNIQYKADGSSNDDIAMSCVNITQGMKHVYFKELIEDFHREKNNQEIQKLMDEILNDLDIKSGTDYESFNRGMKSTERNSNLSGLIN